MTSWEIFKTSNLSKEKKYTYLIKKTVVVDMPPSPVHGSRPETSLSSGFSESEDNGEENYSLCTALPKVHTRECPIPLAMDRAGDAHLTGELW